MTVFPENSGSNDMEKFSNLKDFALFVMINIIKYGHGHRIAPGREIDAIRTSLETVRIADPSLVDNLQNPSDSEIFEAFSRAEFELKQLGEMSLDTEQLLH